MARSERTLEDKMQGDLRRLMDHAGLAGVPVEALGGNHPWSGGGGPPAARRSLPLGLDDDAEDEPVHEPAAETPPVKTDLRRPDGITGAPIIPLLPKTAPAPVKQRRRLPPVPKPEPAAHHPRAPKAARRKAREVLYGAPADIGPEDDNPVALALRIQDLMWEKGLNVTEAARELGRSRAYVRNHLRLLHMPNAITEHVRTGRLTEGHARVIGSMRDPEAIARLVISRQLSVRQTELIARRLRYLGPDGLLIRETAVPNAKFAEDMIAAALGMKVRMKDRGGRGKIEIHYSSPAQGNELVNGLCKVFAGLHEDDFG